MQVPVPSGPPPEATRPLEPAVVRIGPDHTLLDPPWGMVGCAVAHVWLDDRVPGGWVRAAWPSDRWSNRPIAPLDLHLGHVLELSLQRGTALDVRYACVADADPGNVVLVAAASALEAVSMARRAVDVWQAAQLVAVEDAWRERIAAAQRYYDTSI